MFKRKKSNINLLTKFIQNNKSSYVEIGKKLIKYMKELGIPYSNWYNFDNFDIKKRISKIAHGTKPTSEELQGFAFWLFKDPTQWFRFYFPNEKATYKFIKETYKDEVDSIFTDYKKQKELQQKLTLFTKTNVRNGINHHSIKTTELTYISLGLLNFKVQDEIRLGKRTNKVELQEYAIDWINKNLYSNSPLVKQLTIRLCNTLDLNHSNKKELRQIVLRGLISVL